MQMSAPGDSEQSKRFVPVERMLARVEIGKCESDTTYFFDLMYFGEMVAKLAVSGVLAAMDDDRERSRYRHLHTLVRADGIGKWSEVLEESLVGPSSQYFTREFQEDLRDLTQKQGSGSWQWEAVAGLLEALSILDPGITRAGAKIDAKQWISSFAQLRNRTRGHGAPSGSVCARLCVPLESSIRAFSSGFRLFQRDWAFLHRNLSGKYRVTHLGGKSDAFGELKRQTDASFRDGVYVYIDRPRFVALVHSDVDASDVHIANGGFSAREYETLSYITGSTRREDATPFLDPVGSLPASETASVGMLEVKGKAFTNLPARPEPYVARPALEKEVLDALRGERHVVTSLVGRGGIGKTFLALRVLHSLASEGRFDVILWFSARDLDLLSEGPKPVKPDVLSVKDIAKEMVRLVLPSEAARKGFRTDEYLAACLTKSPFGPTLFVFDNFETVDAPGDVYRWLDAHVRAPNKILITTRHRDFRGDFPIDVKGMDEGEFQELVDVTARNLDILDVLTKAYRDELFRESDGHPYVAKILLGEVAKAGRLKNVERIVADSSEILTALFERTYGRLSPAGRRVFLTLSGWRVTLPKVAIEAVLLRSANERMNVDEALHELERSSLIEIFESEEDGQLFVNTPLTACLFGKRQLSVSPMRTSIEADLDLLRLFGPSQREGARLGVGPRVERLVGEIARRIENDGETLERHIEMLRFVCRHYRPAWLLLANLQEEFGGANGVKAAIDSVREYLIDAKDEAERLSGWGRVAQLARRIGDVAAEVHALVQAAECATVPMSVLSNAVFRVNEALGERRDALDFDEKPILLGRLAKVMGARVDEADAYDLSRLAWLHIRLDEERRAYELAALGLERDQWNEHCLRLVTRLGRKHSA